MNNKYSSDPGHCPGISITVPDALMSVFFRLLQEGVRVRSRVGCTVDAFLRQEIGASQETIERIQSIMLDGKPVDDITTALVHDGSILALSAAMPGLVGATLRRGGAYASFRSSITYHEDGAVSAPKEGRVRVKVFNLLMADLGPALLAKGALVSAADVLAILADNSQELLQGSSAIFDGDPVDAGGLQRALSSVGHGSVLLTIVTRSEG